MLWIDASVNSLLSLGSLSLFFFFTIHLSLRHRLTGDIDLIPGMMLSNCRSETDLHNQTVGGKMGHVGKQLFLSVLAWFLNNMSARQHTHTHGSHLFFSEMASSTRRCRRLSCKCCLFWEVVSHVCMFPSSRRCYFVAAAQVTGTNQ